LPSQPLIISLNARSVAPLQVRLYSITSMVGMVGLCLFFFGGVVLRFVYELFEASAARRRRRGTRGAAPHTHTHM
jgi:hypothetical protein